MKTFRVGLLITGTIASIVTLGYILFTPKNNIKIDKNIYATSISVNNLPREIILYKNNSLQFSITPYTVQPDTCTMEVQASITDYRGNIVENAEYINNTFRASSKGTYYLTFSVASSKNHSIKDTIKIIVVDEIDAVDDYIELTSRSKTIYLGDSVNFEDFYIHKKASNSQLEYKINNALSKNNIFIPNSVGKYTISITLNKGDYLFFDEIKIFVEEKPSKSFEITDQFNSTIENNETKHYLLSQETIIFSYIIGNSISQDLTCNSSNTNVLQITSCFAPIIVVDLINQGSADIIIRFNNEIFIINVIVE